MNLNPFEIFSIMSNVLIDDAIKLFWLQLPKNVEIERKKEKESNVYKNIIAAFLLICGYSTICTQSHIQETDIY